MLVETEKALAPDANVVVELTGPESPILDSIARAAMPRGVARDDVIATRARAHSSAR